MIRRSNGKYSLLRLFVGVTLVAIGFALVRYGLIFPLLLPCLLIPYATAVPFAIAIDRRLNSRHPKPIPASSCVSIGVSIHAIFVVVAARSGWIQDPDDVRDLMAFSVFILGVGTLSAAAMLIACVRTRRPIRRWWARISGVLLGAAWLCVILRNEFP